MLKETLHAARTRIKLAGNWSLSSDPEVGLTRANQGLDTRCPANRDWWAKEQGPCFQVSEQCNELIASQKSEGSEQMLQGSQTSNMQELEWKLCLK